MKHHAGLDLPMEATHVCVVDVDGRKIGAHYVESTPEAIASTLALGRSNSAPPLRTSRNPQEIRADQSRSPHRW